MARILLILFLFATPPATGKQKIHLKDLKYDKVILCDYSGGKGRPLVNKDGSLSKTVVKTVQLTDKEIQQINQRLHQKTSYGRGTAFCNNPHLGLVYYIKDSIVANVTICFECNRLYATFDIPAQKQGFTYDNSEYSATGMSKSLRKFFNGFVVKNGFSHGIVPGDVNDE